MADQVTVRLEGNAGAELAALPERMLGSLHGAAWEVALFMEREIKELTPVGATSTLKAGWSAEQPRLQGGAILATVGNSMAHAVPVELGTKPHWAPLEPLVDWVRSKLDQSDQGKAEAIARRIQFAIAARGTLGVGMMHRTFARYGDWGLERLAAAVRGAL